MTIKPVEHPVLENVKLTILGKAIEDMQYEYKILESLYVTLRDTNPQQAQILKNVLEAHDWLTYCYNDVAGY